MVRRSAALRLLSFTVVVVMLTFVAPVLASPPAAADVSVAQWNVDAWTRGDRGARRFVVAAELNTAHPLFHSLNEACVGDVAQIAAVTDYSAVISNVWYSTGVAHEACAPFGAMQYFNVVMFPDSLTFVDWEEFAFGPEAPDGPARYFA
jgi:hypothetical protein